MTDKFILVGKEPKAVSLMEWAAWFEGGVDQRRVALTVLASGVEVSTVFLGLNHNWGPGPPLLFETMVFGSATDSDDLDCRRYSTWAEAEVGHMEMVERLQEVEAQALALLGWA